MPGCRYVFPQTTSAQDGGGALDEIFQVGRIFLSGLFYPHAVQALGVSPFVALTECFMRDGGRGSFVHLRGGGLEQYLGQQLPPDNPLPPSSSSFVPRRSPSASGSIPMATPSSTEFGCGGPLAEASSAEAFPQSFFAFRGFPTDFPRDGLSSLPEVGSHQPRLFAHPESASAVHLDRFCCFCLSKPKHCEIGRPCIITPGVGHMKSVPRSAERIVSKCYQHQGEFTA